MTFGEEGKEGARVHDLRDVEAILHEFKSRGHLEVSHSMALTSRPSCYTLIQIDTARAYAGGTSEEYLGKVGAGGMGFLIETKLYPTVVCCFRFTHPHQLTNQRRNLSRAGEVRPLERT